MRCQDRRGRTGRGEMLPPVNAARCGTTLRSRFVPLACVHEGAAIEPALLPSWCRRWDSNPHEGHPSAVFKTAASAIPPLRHAQSRVLRVSGVLEATTGFEPVNGGFADLCLRPLGYVAPLAPRHRSRRMAAPRGFEPRFTDPKSGVLPLDEGATGARISLRGGTRGSGAEDGTRTRDPHLGKVMLYQLSHFRPILTSSRPAP